MATTPIEVGRHYVFGSSVQVRVTDIQKPEGARGGTPRTHWITYRLADGGDLPAYLPGGAFYSVTDERTCNAGQFRSWFRAAPQEEE